MCFGRSSISLSNKTLTLWRVTSVSWTYSLSVLVLSLVQAMPAKSFMNSPINCACCAWAACIHVTIFCIVSAILAPRFSMLSILWSNAFALSFSSSPRDSVQADVWDLSFLIFSLFLCVLQHCPLLWYLHSRRHLFPLCNFQVCCSLHHLDLEVGFSAETMCFKVSESFLTIISLILSKYWVFVLLPPLCRLFQSLPFLNCSFK